MLAFAHGSGHDTLNTVELPKELEGEQPRRGRVALLGLDFHTL